MKNIYCIVGASGSGKTTLVEALREKYGYKVIESYTTRPPRYEGETGHIFVSPEEFKTLGEMCAYTKFDGYEYGVTADLIEQNDLYVIDPAGVEFLCEKYNGTKGVKVIGITADVDVLVERMDGRGDSDDKIIKRLANDAEMFKNFHYITDIELRSDGCTLDELCEAVQWHIEKYEDLAKHEFTLLNEREEDIYYGRETRFYTLDECKERLKQNYPEGLPEGWSVRDNTEVAQNKYLKAIKKVKPSFKSSIIRISMDGASVSDGYIVVPFKYKEKEYCFRSYNGDDWVTETEKARSTSSAEQRLKYEIDRLYKRINEIDKELDGEYKDGETVCASQPEIVHERLEKTVCYLESALNIVQKENYKNADKPLLDDVIKSAKNTVKKPFEPKLTEKDILYK